VGQIAAPQVVAGSCEPRFAAVREEFERNFAERNELGASVCVIIDGEPVVDLWGGHMDTAKASPWQRDTMNVIMSCSKGLAALCGNMLIDRGQLDPDKPVAHYWPEFAQKGKQDIPVRMVFNHQSGVAHVDTPMPSGAVADFEWMVRALERTTPFWVPGTRAGYHGMAYGVLLGELVRRVDGRSIGTFFRDEVAEPLGLDAWIGLPEEHESRVATTVPMEFGIPKPPDWVPASLANPGSRGFQVLAKTAMRTPPIRRAVARKMRSYTDAAGAPAFVAEQVAQLDSLLLKAVGNMGGWPEGCDSRRFHAAEIPAAGAIANGRSLAGVYAPLSIGGTMNGVQLVTRGALPVMATAQSVQGVDAIAGCRTSYTMGFSKSWFNPEMVGSSVVIGEDAFGTPGMGGQMGFADPSCRLAFGYTMNRHGPGGALNERGQSLIDAVYRILGSPTCAPGFWLRPT
jgi:CubicO group peptidase (beta-lactamase class C family)